MQKLNKKAAYDLGRKSIYYIVAIIFIALIFVFISNFIKDYQIRSIDYLISLTDLTYEKGIERCISQEDNNRIYLGRLSTPNIDVNVIKNCLEKTGIPGGRDFRITVEEKQVGTTDDPSIEYDSYEKYFLFQNKLKKIKIEVEEIDLAYLYYK